MLIIVFIIFQIISKLSKIALKFFDFGSVFKLFRFNLHHECLKVLSLCFLFDEGKIFVIKFEVGFNKFHKKQIVIADKSCQSCFCIYGCCLWMTFIGDLLTQIADDFVECLEVGYVLADDGFGIGVGFLSHESIKGLLVICNGFPCSADTREYFWQILNPAIEILIFFIEFLILFAIILQFYCHLRILLDQQLNLKLLIFH